MAAERFGVASVEDELQKCTKCDEIIRGYKASCDGRLYHFGCAPSQDHFGCAPSQEQGRRLLVPQHFVQLSGDTSDRDLSETLEAIEVQRAARLRSWITLPEGRAVFVSGIAQADNGTHQEFHENVLATIANPHSVDGQFLYKYVTEDSQRWRAEASCVYPIVVHRVDLQALEELDQAQRQVSRFTFDLPVGQLVEVKAKLMVTTALCDGQSYKVRPWSVAGKERMAADYSVADLLHLSHAQLADLWEHYGLPTRSYQSPDAYVEEAMEFLPACREVNPTEVSCLDLRPLITDTRELLPLRDRHMAAERFGVQQLAASKEAYHAAPAPRSVALEEHILADVLRISQLEADARAEQECRPLHQDGSEFA